MKVASFLPQFALLAGAIGLSLNAAAEPAKAIPLGQAADDLATVLIANPKAVAEFSTIANTVHGSAVETTKLPVTPEGASTEINVYTLRGMNIRGDIVDMSGTLTITEKRRCHGRGGCFSTFETKVEKDR
ncbi:MAG: hypothetical protein AB7P04_01690 [Bacteriovoracia bacterium]